MWRLVFYFLLFQNLLSDFCEEIFLYWSLKERLYRYKSLPRLHCDFSVDNVIVASLMMAINHFQNPSVFIFMLTKNCCLYLLVSGFAVKQNFTHAEIPVPTASQSFDWNRKFVTKWFLSHFSQEPHGLAFWYMAQGINMENCIV